MTNVIASFGQIFSCEQCYYASYALKAGGAFSFHQVFKLEVQIGFFFIHPIFDHQRLPMCWKLEVLLLVAISQQFRQFWSHLGLDIWSIPPWSWYPDMDLTLFPSKPALHYKHSHRPLCMWIDCQIGKHGPKRENMSGQRNRRLRAQVK